MSEAAPAVCPVCERVLTNPPERIDLPGGATSVLVHPACAKRGLSEAQVQAILEARK